MKTSTFSLVSSLGALMAALGAAVCVPAQSQDLGGASATSAMAPLPELVTWVMPEVDKPPASSPAGPSTRRGLSQPLADYLMAHWGNPPVRHQVLIANIKRGWRMLEAGEPVCHLGALHTPDRESVAVFYDTHLIPPHQLMVRRQALPQLPRNAQGDVDLDALWALGTLRGALVQGRSYGTALDAQLARRPAAAIQTYVMPDFGANLLAMVAVGRADYTLEYDFMLAQVGATRMAGGSDLVSVPLQGFSDPVVSGVACPRNDWGRRMIAQVERVLSTAKARQAMKEELLSHLSAEAKARYGARIEAFYARPPGR